MSSQPSNVTDHDNHQEIDSGDEEEQDAEFSDSVRNEQKLIMRRNLPEHLKEKDFRKHLGNYPKYVREVYQHLETARFEIGHKLSDMKPSYITRTELIKMDKWMQKRGTSLKKEFHQRTAKFIESNSEDEVKRISNRAFQRYKYKEGNDLTVRGKRSKKGKIETNSQERPVEKGTASVHDALQAMAILEDLNGVARARSSLLLSVAFRQTVPYLSRALYRWMNWDDKTGWTQKFEWTTDRKRQLLDKVRKMAEDYKVDAVDVEKVAFVLECEGRIAGLRNTKITAGLVQNRDQKGSGASGTVFQIPPGTDGFGGETVAIKRISRTLLPVDTARHRFLAEVGISSRLPKLSSDHFVKFRGWNEDVNNLYIAMECVPNGDLEKSLKDHATEWTKTAIREAARQILEGLCYMHDASIAHRDLKPQNILVVSPPPNVKVKIADFGVAKRLSDRGTTALRTTAGTPGYRAPEVVRYWDTESDTDQPHMYSFNVDIWSLGCIIYRMAKGVRLFRGDSEVLDTKHLIKKVGKIGKELRSKDGNGVKPRIKDSGICFVLSLVVIEAEKRPDAHRATQRFAYWEV